MNACNSCGATVADDAQFEATGGYCAECDGDRAVPVMSNEAVCSVLQPLMEIGIVGELNGPAGYRLAELIAPRNAAELTVREVQGLLQQISREMNR